MKKIVSIIICAVMLMTLSVAAFAKSNESGIVTGSLSDELKININGQTLTAYCFNGSRIGPGEGMSYNRIDSYNLSDSLKNKILKLFYAGYPINGKNYFTIGIPDIRLSEEEFDSYLIITEEIYSVLPAYRVGQVLTQSDSMSFVYACISTSNSVLLKSNTFKAANCLAFSDSKAEAIEMYKNSYLSEQDSVITQQTAFSATQEVLWYLLKTHSVPENNKGRVETALEKKLYAYVEGNELLPTEESLSDFSVSEIIFTYDGDKGFVSNDIIIRQHGDFVMTNLPEGMSIAENRENDFTVRGNTPFRLYCDYDAMPESGDITVRSLDKRVVPTGINLFGTDDKAYIRQDLIAVAKQEIYAQGAAAFSVVYESADGVILPDDYPVAPILPPEPELPSQPEPPLEPESTTKSEPTTEPESATETESESTTLQNGITDVPDTGDSGSITIALIIFILCSLTAATLVCKAHLSGGRFS